MSVVKVKDGSSYLDFLTDFVPAAEKTALLYNMSYLCLARFPDLERTVRASAVESQLAFVTSHALMLQCIYTSDNLVKALFPMIILSVNNDLPALAKSQLEKARTWIGDIIHGVDKMADDYDGLAKKVASATSEVNTTKQTTKDKIETLGKEYEATKAEADTMTNSVKSKASELAENEKNMEAATKELEDNIKDIAARNHKFAIAAAVVPFIGEIVYLAQMLINSSTDKAQLEKGKLKISNLQGERTILASELGTFQIKLMDFQFKLTIAEFKKDAVPNPVHLGEVQTYMTRIQQIFIQLSSFWQHVEKMLMAMEQQAFSGNDQLDYLKTIGKESFLANIEVAIRAWGRFRDACINVKHIFALKNKDAYKFLETSPSSLSKAEWDRQYKDVMLRLGECYKTPKAIKKRGAKP